MAETANRAAIADKVFSEVFHVFGWERLAGKNRNWACALPDRHMTPMGDPKKTHPSDLVCRYDDPYFDRSVYVNIDLKAFSETSITKPRVGGAVHDLAMASECLHVSKEWQDAYVRSGDNARSVGLLFLTNSDGKYVGNFRELVEMSDQSNRALGAGSRMYLMGPADVAYLWNVATDIQKLCAGLKCEHAFFYPNLIRRPARRPEGGTASIESLTGPWLFVRLLTGDAPRKYVVYYRGRGSTFEEFAYLIDLLLRLQLEETSEIQVRLVNPDPKAAEKWPLAVDYYVSRFHELDELKERLTKIKPTTVSTAFYRFSEIEIGLEDDAS